jgi:hypothetical protein
LSPATFTDNALTVTGLPVKDVRIQELRAAFAAARAIIELAPITFSRI